MTRGTRCRPGIDRLSSARQLAQGVLSVLVEQETALLVPGPEHDALDGLSPRQRIVHRGPVGVTMDHLAYLCDTEGLFYRARIYVHDARQGLRRVGLAAGLRLIGQEHAGARAVRTETAVATQGLSRSCAAPDRRGHRCRVHRRRSEGPTRRRCARSSGLVTCAFVGRRSHRLGHFQQAPPSAVPRARTCSYTL